jgi:hypothetical protein
MKDFKAPWGTSLIVMSTLATVLCLGFTFFHWETPTPERLARPDFWIGVLPVALIAGCALFTVRGYSIGEGELLIRRLLWNTRIPLVDLQSAEFRPRAMQGSIRTFGNGGLFSFSGHYRNRELGAYRAFVSDFHRTTILRFPTRTIVVSPEAPEEFVRELALKIPNLPPAAAPR